jgi:hypothetical protein
MIKKRYPFYSPLLLVKAILRNAEKSALRLRRIQSLLLQNSGLLLVLLVNNGIKIKKSPAF